MARKPAGKTQAHRGATGTPLVEWIAGALGLVLVILTLGVIGREALFGDRSPPSVTVEARAVQAVQGGWLAQIEVVNGGGSPAAAVAVEGELTLPGRPPETAEATFDYVPDHSRRQGGLFFRQDPRSGRLTLRAKGYTEP